MLRIVGMLRDTHLCRVYHRRAKKDFFFIEIPNTPGRGAICFFGTKQISELNWPKQNHGFDERFAVEVKARPNSCPSA